MTQTLVAGVAAQQCTAGTEQVLGALRRGLDTLRAIAVRTIELPGDRAWIEISPDPADVPEERLAALQALLGPVLRRADSPRPN